MCNEKIKTEEIEKLVLSGVMYNAGQHQFLLFSF